MIEFVWFLNLEEDALKSNMNLSEAEIVFRKILKEDFVLNNTNVSLLQTFISHWADATPEESVRIFLSNWFKEVFELHKQNHMNDVSCIATIFILEAVCQQNELSMDLNFASSIFTRYFIPLHKVIVPQCLRNSTDLMCSNDAVIAFYRLHCQLSKSISGAQLIKKFNLWKPLFHFYLKSDKFNLFIQNSCSEYICNLISSELPHDIGVLVDVITIILQYIKSAIQNDNLCDRALFRSLRFLYLVFSKYLSHMEANSLRLISNKCHSLEHQLWRIASTSNDPTTVRHSLKTYILFKCFLENLDGADSDNNIFRCFVTSACTLVDENDQFMPYVPEIFNISCRNTEFQMQLQNCLSFLQILTILICLKQQFGLNVTQESAGRNQVPLIRDEFKNFIQLYEMKLQNECQLPTMVSGILKNIGCTGESMDLNARVYLISSLNTILKSYEIATKKFADELCEVMRNVIYALTTAVLKAPDTADEVLSSIEEVLSTALNLARNIQHEDIIRVSAFSLCRIILRKIKRISNNNVQLLRHSITRGLTDPCWEVRDSVLELLSNTFSDSLITNESDPVIGDSVVCDALVTALKDNESFVRATAYSVLITSVSSSSKHLWEKFFDYEKLLSNTVQNFRNETENNVRQRMITLIHRIWSFHEITHPVLLVDVYRTMYQASSSDLHSEVRFNGMLFWCSLIQLVTDDEKCKNEVTILEKLGFVGCLQAVVDGIEDEYDNDVMMIALNALRSLHSFDPRPNEFHESENRDTESQSDEINSSSSWFGKQLPNELLMADTSAYIDAKTFLADYCAKNLGQSTGDERPETNRSFDLENLLECFVDTSSVDSEINQKDCY